MVNKVILLGFRGAIVQVNPLDLPLFPVEVLEANMFAFASIVVPLPRAGSSFWCRGLQAEEQPSMNWSQIYEISNFYVWKI